MSELHIEIQENGSIRFFGNTFLVKETIKSLGKSRWNPADKSWIVSESGLSKSQLQNQFPSAIISGTAPLQEATKESSEEEVDAFSVKRLSSDIKSALSRRFAAPIKLYGVISSIKQYGSGRIYFDIRDANETDISLSCVVWENKSEQLKKLKEEGFTLEAELPVMFSAGVSMNIKRGQVSLSVERFFPEYTLGKLLAEREKTNKRLKKEGLFDKNKSLELPFLPKTLGILTSSGGTVINDFKASLDDSKFGFELYWHSVRVQGKEAISDVVSGIQYFDKRKDIDAILIFRGGGSATELSIFSDYELAKAICKSKKPVLSAIGHEQDQSSTQDVSYRSFGVPKDIGRFFADVILDLRSNFTDMLVEVSEGASSVVDLARNELRSVSYSLLQFSKTVNSKTKNQLREISKKLTKIVEANLLEKNSMLGASCSKLLARGEMLLRSSKTSLISVSKDIPKSANRNLRRETEKLRSPLQRIFSILGESLRSSLQALQQYERLFESHSVDRQLKRGFALLMNAQGKALSRLSKVSENKEFIIKMSDGTAQAVLKDEK